MKEQFEAIVRLYEDLAVDIQRTAKNEWAGDPYFWAGELRMTPIEENFWTHLREAGGVMYPQYPVAGFFLDFANPKAMVAVECDGAAFHKDKAKDAARDAKLQALGWTVYRLTGRQCNFDSDEETGEAGFTRKFIDALLRDHGLKRGGSYGDMLGLTARDLLREAP